MKRHEVEEGRRQLGRPEDEWVLSIDMDLGKIEFCSVERIDPAQDMDYWRAFMNTVTNLRAS
jgi:hypothetical protein